MTNSVLAFLATYLIHSTLLLVGAWVLTRWFIRSEAWRETLWKAALVGGVVTAVVAQATSWSPVRLGLPASVVADAAVPVDATLASNPVLFDDDAAASTSRDTDIADESSRGLTEQAAVVRGASAPADVPEPSTTSTAPATTSRRAANVSWPVAILTAWSVIALLLVVRLTMRHVQLARLLRERRMVTEPTPLSLLAEVRRMSGVWVPVGLSSTPAVATPLVWGRREICVPDRFLTELGRDEQRAALAHELGHLARQDPLWLLGAMVLECVFFFQPLNRFARLRLREIAEYRADGWAVRMAGDRLGLARCLAEVATWIVPGPQPALAERVAMAEGGSPLLVRVRRLLDRQPEPEPRIALRVAVGIALIAGGAVLAPAVGLTDQHGAASPSPSPSPSQVEPTAPSSTTDRASLEMNSVDLQGIAQDTLEVVRFDAAARSGRGFIARLNEAGRDAQQRSHWIAYALASPGAAQQIIIDSESWNSGMRRTSVAERLGVARDLAVTDVIVFAQIVPGGSSTGVVRLSARDPRFSMDLSGRVYWFGRAEPEESFRWLSDLYPAMREPRIRETMVDLMGLHPIPAAAAFLRQVIDASEERSVREQAVEGLAWHPSDESLAALTRVAESDTDVSIAQEAVETIGEIDHPDAGHVLRSLIVSGRMDVREEALESLMEVGDTSLAELLFDIAMNDPDPNMRRKAVEYMEELAPVVAVPLLRRVVLETQDVEMSREAVETLGELGSTEAFDALDEVIARATAEEVVFQAIESIAEFPADRAAPLLEQLAANHASVSVRREALEELLDLNVAVMDGASLLDIAMHDPDHDVRRDVVEHIAELPPAEAVPLLRRVVFESNDDTAERQAAESLGDVGTREALDVLDEIIARNPGESASFQAVESIAENFSRDLAIPRLTQIAREHPSSRVRREALDQLRELNGG